MPGNAINYGQRIQLRHCETDRYLASLPKAYVHLGSSGQQMVVGRKVPDAETIWTVHGSPKQGSGFGLGTAVKNGAQIRLTHEETGRNLHSHNHPAPIMRDQHEVSAYGEGGVGDDNDVWKVELDKGDFWLTDSNFRLKHSLTGCVLHSHSGKSDQINTNGEQEVTCFPKGDSNDLWTVPSKALASDPRRSDFSISGRRFVDALGIVGSLASITGWSFVTLRETLQPVTIESVFALTILVLLVLTGLSLAASFLWHAVRKYRATPHPPPTHVFVTSAVILILLVVALIFWHIVPAAANHFVHWTLR